MLIIYLLNAFWTIPLILLSRVAYPRFKIKFGITQSNRIGHFVLDTLEEIIRCQGNNKEITFWATSFISNKQWYKMVKNYLYINPIFKCLTFWNRYIPGSQRHTSVMSLNSGCDTEGKFFTSLIKPKMSNSDIIKSKTWLEKIGWKDEPIICLISRDSKYLDYLDKLAGQEHLDRSYHSYRNSEIETYRLAINYLLEKGYWVFRMGSVTKEKIEVSHPNFLDYSQCNQKSDLLDIYLFSNCSGVISTSTGIDSLSQAYGIPTLVVNGLPLGLAVTFFNTIWVPKKLIWKNTNESLTIKEYIENSFLQTNDYLKAGIEIIDLNEIEIFNAVVELTARIEGQDKVNNEEIKLQETFIDLLRNWKEFSLHHGFLHPGFKLGKDWIYSMKNKVS
jgi:putative glycosyltransferase (TIGR04372 family)